MRQPHNDATTNERRYWLWVTRPEFYLDENGDDKADLDPDSGVDSDGWWTCHKDTHIGDLAFLWRTTPKRDIGYLFQADSDAYSIAEDEYASEKGWDYACDYQVVYKFKDPVTLEDIRRTPHLEDWGALRASFQRRVYAIPNDHWQRLNQLAAEKNTRYQESLASVERDAIPRRIVLEEQLEEALANDLSVLRRFGYDLELYTDPKDGRLGRQLVCKGNGGRIDLLCYDKAKSQYVVIELKNVPASQQTFAQISNYVVWVEDRIAHDRPVVGLVISRGADVRFQSSARITDRVSQLNLEQLDI